MGDFFTRLAERTLGLAPAVKPYLMPVFLTVPESPVVGDSSPRPEETLDRTSTPSRKSSPRGADSISQNMSTKESATIDGDAPQSTTQSWNHSVAVPARDGREVDWQLKAPNREPRAVESRTTHAKQNVVEIERNNVTPEFKTGEKTSSAEIRQWTHANAVTAQSNLSEARPTAAPAIQISIGRVEVRAAVQPAPMPRVVERKAPTRLSLEQYLRERNEGRR